MRRLLLASVPLAILFGAAACGDGADEDPGVEPTATVFATPTTGSNEQPQVPDTPVAQPTPIPDHLPIIQVAFAGKALRPPPKRVPGPAEREDHGRWQDL
ncbi:MAG: hypothetical protein IPI85_09655 [Dehalococcoidia bacterium]|nr:hypothetical protein [Dehalococcoidia bacterium]